MEFLRRVMEIGSSSRELREAAEELAARSEYIATRERSASIAQEMERVFDRLDDLHDLAKQWLRMTGLVYLAVERDSTVIRYAFGRWDRLGYEPSELIGMTLAEIVHPDDIERTNAEVVNRPDAYCQQGVVFRNRYRCAKGGWAALEWYGEGGDSIDGLVCGAARIAETCEREGCDCYDE